MKNSVEGLWRQERRARSKMIRLCLGVVFVALLLLAALCFWIAQPLLFPKTKTANIIVDAERLKTHVEKLSIEFSPRSHSFTTNLDKTAAYIKAELERAGAKTTEQTFEANGKTYRNVIAAFGADTTERIVIGAHYGRGVEFSGG